MRRLVRSLSFAIAIALAFAGAAAAQMSNDECLGCHNDAALTKDLGGGKSASVHVDPAKFGESVHSVLECSSCHADISEYPHEPAPAKVSCDTCHSDAQAQHEKGLHAKANAAGNRNAASCASCHGNIHAVKASTDPASPTYHTNIPRTCGACHSQKFVMETSGFSTQPLFSYRESVHGQAVAQGSMKAAVCTDCHGAHEILSPRDSSSPINRFNIPQTCGKCHGPVTAEFMNSIHGKAVARGNGQSPVCTDCHGIHDIKDHIDPASSVASQQIARTTCGQCHAGVKLTRELGIASGRVQSYQDSYHGLAKRLGSDVAANCASCHGVHNILPSSDPTAMTHKANLAHTCGTCHPGATDNFAKGKVHLEAVPTGGDIGEVAVRWIRWVYLLLIWGTIGFMLLHNALVWWKKASARRRDPSRIVVRMNKTQRIQHFLLLTSFIALVLSGFALAWPESWFAWLFGADEMIRRGVHRAAAVVMMLLGVYHVFYMVGTKEGRQGLRDFWFRFKDARDLVDAMKYATGLSKTHPRMGRFGYAEKLEYWAVVWGTMVMGVTGLMLWFEVEVMHFLPRWWLDIALTIHFYEAVLATLAILVWHFYQVFFDPDVYPMSWAWFDGKITEEQMKHEHAEEYDEWKKEQGGTDNDAPPEG